MHHLRYNIAGALGAILFVGVGIAALREADELWDRWLSYLALVLLLDAVLLAALRTGDRRAFWIGFALFGWGYSGLSLVPSTQPRLIATKALLHLHQSTLFGIRAYEMRLILSPDRMRVHNVSSDDITKELSPSTMVGSPLYVATKTSQTKEYELTHTGLCNKPKVIENVVLKATADGEILRLKDVARIEMGSSIYIPRIGTAANKHFIHIGHTLFALLAAWLGGVLFRRLGTVSLTPEVPSEGG
jgi:hypothetical protein